jgi:hypothetical protein
MKNLLLPAVVLFSVLLASCSKYQINMVSSTNAVKDAQTGVFNVENDSVKISYSFYGNNAPVSIQVFNKSDKPLYIDWQSSAVVIGEKTISYANKNVPIRGDISGTTDTYNTGNRRSTVYPQYSYSSGSINAVAKLPDNVTFIPPHAQSNNVPLNITNGFINIPDSVLHKDQIGLIEQYSTVPVNVKTASFTKENSPLVFKSFLTVYTMQNNQPKPTLYEQEFFVSKLVNSSNNPKNLTDYQVQRGDYFISSKKTGYAKVMTGIGVAAAVGGIAVAGASADNSNNNQ